LREAASGIDARGRDVEVGGVGSAPGAVVVPGGARAADAGPFTQSFTFSGEYAFAVPAGVNAIAVHAVGGFGGVDFGAPGFAPGGLGGTDTSRSLPFVTLTWTVAPAPAPTLRVDLRGTRPQLLTEKKSISVIVGCGPVACTIGASGSVRVPGRKAMRLRSRHATLPQSKTARLHLATSKALRAAVRRAIRRHHTVTVKIAISAKAPGAATVRRDEIVRVRAPRS
jgi:hypothetical protein